VWVSTAVSADFSSQDIPHIGRNDTARSDNAGHFHGGLDGIRKKAEHKSHYGHIEAAVGQRRSSDRVR